MISIDLVDRPDDAEEMDVCDVTDDASLSLHMVIVRRYGDEFAPDRWRAYCHGCHGWRLAPDGSYGSWQKIMNEVMFHLITGMWE